MPTVPTATAATANAPERRQAAIAASTMLARANASCTKTPMMMSERTLHHQGAAGASHSSPRSSRSMRPYRTLNATM